MILPGFPDLPLAPAERTIPKMLERQAARYGSRRLFSCLGEDWLFDDAPGIAARMAGALREAGVKAGDRVAILSANRPELMRALLGCAWLGAVAVPLNTGVKTRQLRYYLENSGAKLLIAEGALLAALESDALDGLPLESVWVLGETIAASPLPFTGEGGPSAAEGRVRGKFDPSSPAGPTPEGGRRRGAATILTKLFRSDGPSLPAHTARPGHPFAILYTSGTTGAPKGVICPHAQFHWWALYTARFLEIREGDVLATTLPLFHTNAINTFFQALLTGSTQVVLPKFSASGFWRSMVETGATVGYLLGAMVPMLMAQAPSPEERSHALRVMLGPGVPGPMHRALFERTGVRLVDGFGSTETNFIIGGPARERIDGRMGRPAPGVEARVVDEDDAEVPAGEPGELTVRSSEPWCFASGYHGMPEKTAESWRNLWVHTGDRVIRHADGTFSFVDRLKDVIRRRGENISSFEVEQALLSHPLVETAAVYPVPSELAEDEVMAALVVKPGAALTAGEVFAFCARELPRHCVPRYVELMTDLPRTENGKVQKFALRERGVTGKTVDRQAPSLAPSLRGEGG